METCALQLQHYYRQREIGPFASHRKQLIRQYWLAYWRWLWPSWMCADCTWRKVVSQFRARMNENIEDLSKSVTLLSYVKDDSLSVYQADYCPPSKSNQGSHCFHSPASPSHWSIKQLCLFYCSFVIQSMLIETTSGGHLAGCELIHIGSNAHFGWTLECASKRIEYPFVDKYGQA